VAELIEHSGVVERIEGDAVLVRITSHSACGSCRARAACGLAETQEKIVEVHTPESGSYHPGEEVSVGVRRRAGAVAVVYAYVGALAVLLVVLMVSSLALGWSDGASALAALAGVALYYGVLGLFRRRIEHTIHFTITKH